MNDTTTPADTAALNRAAAGQAHPDDLDRDELIVIATDAIDGIEPAARPQHSPWPSTERLATAVVDALLDRLAAAYGTGEG